MKATGGQAFGRPPLGNPSRHLLTNLAQCGACGGPLQVVSRSHGASRKRLYGCSGHHERGICTNRADVPMGDADEIVIEALLDDVLDETILTDGIDEAVRQLQGDDVADRVQAIEAQLADITRQRDRLVAAIAAGGQLPGLLDGLREREAMRLRLERDRTALRAQRGLRASDVDHVRNDLHRLAQSWRQGTLIGLFAREMTGRGLVPNRGPTRVDTRNPWRSQSRMTMIHAHVFNQTCD